MVVKPIEVIEAEAVSGLIRLEQVGCTYPLEITPALERSRLYQDESPGQGLSVTTSVGTKAETARPEPE